jgi:hypothetical protein
MPVGTWHIPASPEPLGTAHWLDNLVSDVLKPSPSLITRITTILLLSCGFANRATNKDIKN